MTATELLPSLESVHPRGPHRWSAKCPAHADRSPSLSVTEGDKGILLKCWAGCDIRAITGKLGLSVKDLFYDGLPEPGQRREALQRRTQERAAQKAAYEAEGRRLDILREAEHLILSAQGLSIAGWSDDKLNSALDRLGAAYGLLEGEGRS